MKKILLVYPESPNSFWSFNYALKFISKKSCYPPLGLITVAAMLPGTWEKKLIDMNVSSLSDKDLLWADYVFISAMTVQRESARNVINRCKALKIKTVAGGPLFTCEHEEFGDVDHLLLNEGELTVPEFVSDIEKGNPRHLYTSDEWADMEKTPIPLWELVDIKKYASLNVQYSRGCPFHCDFCNVTALFGHTPRTKSTEQIMRELDAIHKVGWKGGVFFVDDNFIGNKKKLKEEILPTLIKWMEDKKYPFTFTTEASINLVDDEELMRLMVRAGFETVFVGIETVSDAGFMECNKVQNKNRNMIACVKKMHRFGLQVQGGFIVGFDSDEPSVFKNMVSFIQESGIVEAMVGLLNAPKGTRLYDRLMEEGRIDAEFSGDNTDFSMNFKPKMDHNVLDNGYKYITHSIYSPDQYHKRMMTFLREYHPVKYGRLRIHLSDIAAFMKANVRLGILEKERKYYWKTLLWSAFRRPNVLPLAITLSICGYHFRKTFEMETAQ